MIPSSLFRELNVGFCNKKNLIRFSSFLLYFFCFWFGMYACFSFSDFVCHHHNILSINLFKNICSFIYRIWQFHFWVSILFFSIVFSFSCWWVKKKFGKTEKNYFWILSLFVCIIYTLIIGWPIYRCICATSPV